MAEYRDYEIKCEDERDLEQRRDTFKGKMKEENLFMHCDRNTIILKNRSRYTFVVKPSVPDIDDEHLPKEAFARRKQNAVS